ncbi:MAG TPA: hypothetical protein VN693_06770 [Rhodanobacteraceae bacterium]|nr:hypothetical protein [Rhodanobacteraceae bacterium]
MNKLLIASCFVLANGFAVNAIAQDAATQTSGSVTPSAIDQNANADGKVAIGTRAVPAPGDRDCVRDTGSHIPPPKGKCLPVAGRSYSHEDIQRTGQQDIGQALQQLDPSVHVSGH